MVWTGKEIKIPVCPGCTCTRRSKFLTHSLSYNSKIVVVVVYVAFASARSGDGWKLHCNKSHFKSNFSSITPKLYVSNCENYCKNSITYSHKIVVVVMYVCGFSFRKERWWMKIALPITHTSSQVLREKSSLLRPTPSLQSHTDFLVIDCYRVFLTLFSFVNLPSL